MFGIINPLSYLIGTIILVIMPGPNSMFCLSVAAQHGARKAYRAVCGVLLGDLVLILLTVLGAGTALKLYPALFHAMKLAGGLYLAYIGSGLLRGALRKWFAPPPVLAAGLPPTPPAGHIFKRALLLSLTNPKAILFLLSFFVQFVDPAYPHPALSFLLLALVMQTVSFSYLTLLVFAGHRLANLFRRHRHVTTACTATTGLLFIGFAVSLWLAGTEF
ncbi:leucine efflux protein LeuE [Eikenella sp. NML080894]|uniref:leucine efflux protein LeuE n=1 Tax=Eikenella TaxID=538 RepID=UPI0007E16134|nr:MULTISPECIES: leucine efflux protein LeuE [Eikenella]OAM35414.1 leucine efflux protein LeuE [Eikenella sp. NML080894]OAM35784.1 leucine efflux protein LeuE [Eikenella sp. NML120348]OAM44051.1 leucine efflux protein LeuE [Eikenella sp. NML99-0057]